MLTVFFLLTFWAGASRLTALELQSAKKQAALNNVATAALEAGTYVPGEVLVKFYNGGDTMQTEDLMVTLGTEQKTNLTGIGFKHFQLPDGMTVAESMDKLTDDPRIKYVEPNYLFWPTVLPNDPNFGAQWGLRNTGQAVNGQAGRSGMDIKAAGAWDIVRGNSNIVIAVIDTGLDINHGDIRPNLWINRGELGGVSLNNWSPNGVDDDNNGFVDDIVGWDFNFNVNDPRDLLSGHGTHVSGIAAAAGNNGAGISGMAWNAKIMPLAVQDYNTGALPVAAIVAALSYAKNMGAHIINMSFGSNQYSRAMEEAINQVNGAVMCAAAGNENSNNDVVPHYPSNFTKNNLIAVAAFNQNGAIANYSNYGATNVDVSAPGSNILSTVPGGGFGYLNGSSMACPFVAGLAALIKAKNGTLGAGQIVSRIIRTSVSQAGSPKPIAAGRVNALAAVRNAGDGGEDGGDDGGGGCFIDVLFNALPATGRR
jgi:subtilisin family serine protease